MSLEKYCGIPIYLEKIDSELYNAIYSLCATGFLIARKPDGGCTFIHPARGSPVWNTIVEGAPEEALRVLKSLIIMSNIEGKPGKYINKHFNEVDYDGSHLKAGDVEIKITKDEKFSPKEGKELSVFHYDGKVKLPSVGLPKIEDVKQFMEAQKKGGLDRVLKEKTDMKTLHRKNTIQMCEAFSKSKSENAYVESVLSYMIWAEKRNPDYFTSNCQFRALTGNPMVDYFTVLQLAYNNPSKEHVKRIQMWLSDTNGAYLGDVNEDLFKTYRNLYNKQLSKYPQKPSQQEKIIYLYNENVVGFTKQLEALYISENKGDEYKAVMHAWIDEMRFIGNELYRRFLENPNLKSFSEFESTMRNTCEPAKKFSDLLCFKEKSSPDYHICTALKFTRSGSALFVPNPIVKLSPEDLELEKAKEVPIGESKQVSLEPYDLWKLVSNFKHPSAKPIISIKLFELFLSSRD